MIILRILTRMKIQKMKINNLNQEDQIVQKLIKIKMIQMKKHIVFNKKFKDFVIYVNVLNLQELITVVFVNNVF